MEVWNPPLSSIRIVSPGPVSQAWGKPPSYTKKRKKSLREQQKLAQAVNPIYLTRCTVGDTCGDCHQTNPDR